MISVDEVDQVRLKAGRFHSEGKKQEAQELMRQMQIDVLETIALGKARSAPALAYRALLPPVSS